jgi:hypothetical protein
MQKRSKNNAKRAPELCHFRGFFSPCTAVVGGAVICFVAPQAGSMLDGTWYPRRGLKRADRICQRPHRSPVLTSLDTPNLLKDPLSGGP